MSAHSFTPGPWAYDEEFCAIRGNGESIVEEMGWPGKVNETVAAERIANAHLIAAAPKMLAELEAMVARFSSGNPWSLTPDDVAMRNSASNVIAWALGEKPCRSCDGVGEHCMECGSPPDDCRCDAVDASVIPCAACKEVTA